MTTPDRLKAVTAHVVYFDRVGFSALTIENQTRLTEEVNELIRKLDDFNEAVASETVLALDTGDGQALVFLGDPQVAASVAMHLVSYSRQQTLHKLRVGLNTGPITIRTDLMGKPNATGSGIDLAARVQSIAEPDVLYVSQSTADQLSAFSAWRTRLVDLGFKLVKHAQQIRVYAVSSSEAGGLSPALGPAVAISVPPETITAPQSPDPIPPVGGGVRRESRKRNQLVIWIVGAALLALVGGLLARSNLLSGASRIDLSKGLVAYFPGEGMASDKAGEHDGMLVGGAGYVQGQVGRAFQLDGATQFVEIPIDPDWSFEEKPFTLSLWVKFTSLRRNGSLPNVFLSCDEGPGQMNKWVFYCDGAGTPIFHFVNGPQTIFVAPSDRLAVIAGRWNMFTVTRDGKVFTFYVNGKSLGSMTSRVAVPVLNATLKIGQAEGGGFLNGSVDEVRIYNRALSDEEIASLLKGSY